MADQIVQEIIDFVESGEGWDEFEWEVDRWHSDAEWNVQHRKAGYDQFKVLETTGGMDEGSNASITFTYKGRTFRKSGYYASHYGYDWDGELIEVRPVEKTITVYEAIND